MKAQTESRHFLLVFLILILSLIGLRFAGLPLKDFVEYWAAGQLLVAGQNPYDPELVANLEWETGRDPAEGAILMWNPPWVLPIVLPLGYLSASTGHFLWLLLQLGSVLLAAELLWRYYEGAPDRRLLALLLAMIFIPACAAWTIGQISALVLLGLVLFLVLIRMNRDFLAGMAATLIAIKPHLTWLFWAALLLWVVQTGRWKVILGGVVAGLILSGIALLWRPMVFAEYLETTSPQRSFSRSDSAGSSLQQYRSPTLGTLIRLLLGEKQSAFWWQFVPMIPGLMWFLWYWTRKGSSWQWSREMPLVILISALTTAYGAWHFDLVVHLIAVIAVFAGLSLQADKRWENLGLVAFLLINLIALFQVINEVHVIYLTWLNPALLLFYLSFHPKEQGLPSPNPGAINSSTP